MLTFFLHKTASKLSSELRCTTNWTYHAIHRQELISPLQTTVAVSDTTWDDAGDVNGRVLLLPSHYVEPQAFLRLWQLHHAGMWVAFTGCKSCNSSLQKGLEGLLGNQSPRFCSTFLIVYPCTYLGCSIGPDFRTTVDVHRFIHMLIHLQNVKSKRL